MVGDRRERSLQEGKEADDGGDGAKRGAKDCALPPALGAASDAP